MSLFASVSRPEEFLQLFEKLCEEFHTRNVKEAEKGLLEFRKQPNVLQICQYILEHSQIPVAQFQIILTIRDVLLRDWINVSPDQKSTTRNFLFHIILSSERRFQDFVVRQILQTLAILCKRGWLEPSQTSIRDSVFRPLTDILQGNDDISRKNTVIHFFLALVDEFSYSKSNGLGLAWEYHHRCYQDFEKQDLPNIFALAITFLKSVMSNYVPSRVTSLVVKDSVNLLAEVLSWRYEDPTERLNVSFKSDLSPPQSINPPVSWGNLLISSDSLDFFFKLYSLRDPELSHVLLLAITQMSSINGAIFGNDTVKLEYITRLLVGATNLLKVNQLTGIIELAGLSNVVARLISNYRLPSLVRSDQFQPFLLEFAQFSCKCLEFFKSCNDHDVRIEVEECFENLLDSWVILLSDQAAQTNPLNTFLKELAFRIFQFYVETRLTVAKAELASDDEDEINDADEKKYQEHLISVAFLGRFDALSSLNYLNTILNERCANLEKFLQFGAQSGVNIELLSEELHWIILIIGHFVADAGISEIPEVPDALNSLSKAFQQRGGDPLIALLTSVFKVIQFVNQCISGTAKQAISPLLGKTLAWFINRWCKTYLMTETANTSSTIVHNYGKERGGPQLLDFIVQTILTNLDKWDGEIPIAIETCQILLTLSQVKQIPSHLINLPSFQELLKAHAASHPLLTRLTPVAQRTYMQALVSMTDSVGGNSLDGEKARASYYTQITRPLTDGFKQLLSRQDFTKVSQNPQIIFTVSSMLERFRGLARGLISEEGAIYKTCVEFFNAFVNLLPVYKDTPEIHIIIFKFFCDFTEYQSQYLSDDEPLQLFNAAIELFKKYSALNLGKVKLKSLEDEKEAYKDIFSMLKLLCILSGFSNDFNEVQEIIFIGLSILLPMITTELLEFPKLCNTYFTLVCMLFEDCPHKVGALPSHLFTSLLNSLKYGANHADVEIARKSIEALGSIGKYHFTTRLENGTEAVGEQILVDCLSFLLNFLLFNDFSSDLLPTTSDALLALICAEQKSYSAIVHQLISQQTDQTLRDRLSVAFTDLMTKNNIGAAIDRKNLDSFRRNVEEFVTKVKSYLLRK